MKALGKKPPQTPTMTKEACCRQREHYRKALLELAEEIERMDNWIWEADVECDFDSLAEKARISAGEKRD